MNTDATVSAISKTGIKITKRTLHRWQKESLIPTPESGSHGRGIGAYAEYPEDTPAEFYASWQMINIHKIQRPEVAEIRKRALAGNVDTETEMWLTYKGEGYENLLRAVEYETDVCVASAGEKETEVELRKLQLEYFTTLRNYSKRIGELGEKVEKWAEKYSVLEAEYNRLSKENADLKALLKQKY